MVLERLTRKVRNLPPYGYFGGQRKVKGMSMNNSDQAFVSTRSVLTFGAWEISVPVPDRAVFRRADRMLDDKGCRFADREYNPVSRQFCGETPSGRAIFIHMDDVLQDLAKPKGEGA